MLTGGLGAAGLPDCLWAGSIGAAQTLVIRDGAQQPGVACDRSHWLGLEGDREETFFSGAHANNRRFSPTLANRTMPSALSSSPITSSTTPSPHLPCITSSPTRKPRFSAPVVRAGVAPRPLRADSTMPALPRSANRASRPPSTIRVRCSGISLRKRLGGLYWVDPNSERLHAWDRYSRSRALVMPT